MRRPRALRAGDRVAIVAPASYCARDEFDRGLAELRRLGYEPVYDDSVFEHAAFTAGSPQTRAAAFLKAWNDPGIAALIAARGGYGSVHLLPLLGSLTTTRPKLFIGYSDNTSLMSWLVGHHAIPTLHGPMIDGRLARGSSGYDESSFVALLQGGAGLMLRPDGVYPLRDGEASGVLVGGTITQLAASLGTPYAFDPPPGCLLFLEDVNERPFRLHRLLTQLQLAGILGRAAGVIFGEMRGCDEPDGAATARAVIEEFVPQLRGPVVSGFPSGHTTGACWTIPLGVTCRLLTAPHPTLIVEESPVE